MTLPSTKTSTEPLPGNGITKTFDFDFKVWSVSQLAVWFKDGDDASVELTENYTITLNPDQDTSPGGYVTYPVTGDPLTSSQFITILRAMPFTQGINITEGQSFSAPVIMQALDQATAERQELSERIERSFSVVPGEDKPEDYLNQAEAARDASMDYASESMGYRDQSQGYASESMGYRDQSQTYADNSAASAAEAEAAATALASEFPNAWPRHCLQSEGLGINVDSTPDVQGNEALSEQGNGSSRNVVFGLNATDKHMFNLFKGRGPTALGWLETSSLLGVGKHLQIDTAAALTSDANGVTSFNSDGVSVGSLNLVNISGENIFEFAAQCSHEKVRKFENVKSVIFDFADNYGIFDFVDIRSIEFYYQGVLIEMPGSNFTAYATTDNGIGYEPENAFDTTLSKIGLWTDTEWVSANGSYTNQRLIVVFNSAQIFDRIVINNGHNSGGGTGRGVKNTKIYTSTNDETPAGSPVYGEAVTNSELIFDGQIAQHTASDVIDDKYYCGVHWAYNPATGFFMLLHDGDSGSADFPIGNITGKDVIWSSTKNLDDGTDSHIVYNVISGIENYLFLNTTAAVATSSTSFNEMSETQLLFGADLRANRAGDRYFTWGFVGENLGHITPGMWGVEGAVSIHRTTGSATYDCGVDVSKVKWVICKRLDSAGSWYNHNSVSGFDKYFAFDTGIEQSAANLEVSFSGSEITIGSFYDGMDLLVLVIGEDGEMPTGKTVNINADADNPACFTLASGYSALTGPKDYQISEEANKQLAFTEDDGLYGVYVDKDKNYTLGAVLPDFDSTPGVMKSPTGKLKWAEVQITDNTIVDLDLMPKGNYYIIAHIAGDASAVNMLDNYFGCTKIDFTVYGTDDITGDIEYEEIAVTAKTINSSYFKFTNPGSVPAYLMIYVRRRW